MFSCFLFFTFYGKLKTASLFTIFYLKGFIERSHNPFLWIYEKDKVEIIKANIKNIAVNNNYYTFTTQDGSKDSDTLEKLLSRIEGSVAPVFQKIKRHENLTPEERSNFALFLALLYVRVPSFRQNTETAMADVIKKMSRMMASCKINFEKSIKQIKKEAGKEISMHSEELRRFILDGEYDIKVNPQISLMDFGMVQSLAKVFFNMKWVFFTATDDYRFLTSDNPIAINDPTYKPGSLYGIGLLNKYIEVIFPVSKEMVFFGTWEKNERYTSLKDGYRPSNNNMVKLFTKIIAGSSLKYIFASSKSEILHRLVQKYIGCERLVLRID